MSIVKTTLSCWKWYYLSGRPRGNHGVSLCKFSTDYTGDEEDSFQILGWNTSTEIKRFAISSWQETLQTILAVWLRGESRQMLCAMNTEASVRKYNHCKGVAVCKLATAELFLFVWSSAVLGSPSEGRWGADWATPQGNKPKKNLSSMRRAQGPTWAPDDISEKILKKN